MRRLLHALIGGRPLRHRPVALSLGEQQPARALVVAPGGEQDVTGKLFPVSLAPLRLGLARQREEPPVGPTTIRVRDRTAGGLLGVLECEPAGAVEHPGGTLDLLRPTRSSVHCVSAAERIWRYALAWQHARRNARRPYAFVMSFADLCALNVFYMLPRPVYLVSVVHEDAGNLFPMDLVGPLGDRGFLLALRLTSPSVELMRASGKIAVSAVPASWKEVAYRLGDHHRKRTIAWDELPFAVAPSPVLALPVPVDALGLRELELAHAEPVGSHMLFATEVKIASTRDHAPQLCHVSDMYAQWRAAAGQPFVDA